jgi:hypothetical protein
LDEVQEAFDFRVDERLEVLGRVVRERLGEEDAGVVDQRVDRLEATQRRLDDLGGSCRLVDVAVRHIRITPNLLLFLPRSIYLSPVPLSNSFSKKTRSAGAGKNPTVND